jgi:hypothetical protein
LLMEELDYNLLFRWFVGLNMDDPVWDPTVFSKNRERMTEADVARAFFEEAGQLARDEGLMSNEHFAVDGTLIEALASQKSFKPRAEAKQPPRDPDPGKPGVNFRGEERRNDTHQSTTDPEARLYRKSLGQEAKLAFQGNVLMENRNGLVVETRLTPATGKAERQAALDMVEARAGGSHPTVGGDKAYDTHGFCGLGASFGGYPARGAEQRAPGRERH